MPELPEVENVRRTLAERLVGRLIESVELHRPDVVRGKQGPRAMLAGLRVTDVRRHGKQFAIVAENDACVCVHLGMSGRMTVVEADTPPINHTHAVWRLDTGQEIRFIDPRRFGGLWTSDSFDTLLAERWSILGEDALTIRPRTLHHRLVSTQRTLKAALLDQHVTAGLGNIYVDELLFSCRVHPERSADTVPLKHVQRLVRNMRLLLKHAVMSGGSTVRDYTDANGTTGGYQLRHRVYGRGGQPCLRCTQPLVVLRVAGRTTVVCETCQSR